MVRRSVAVAVLAAGAAACAAGPAHAVERRTAFRAAAASQGVSLAVRAAGCGPVVARVDGRRVGQFAGPHRWRRLRMWTRLRPGRHFLRLTASGCRVRLRGVRAVPAGPRPAMAVPLGAAVRWDRLSTDRRLRALALRAFESLTPENELKMERVQPRRGRFSFAKADAIVNFAVRRGKRVRGHTLIWPQQSPPWLRRGRWSAPELRGVLENHVRTVVGHFRGRIDTWDVVNEPLSPGGGWRAGEAPWLAVLGPEYVALALRAARAADPRAKLFVNEFAVEHPGPKLDALVALVRRLRAQRVPLDGVGLQLHTNLALAPSRARLTAALRRLAALGVEVELTEVDVGTSAGRGTGAQRLAAQARAYGGFARACRAVIACGRITVWGVSDRDSWLGPGDRPLLFDDRLAPKPAHRAVLRALGT